MRTTSRTVRALVAASALALVMAACGDDTADAPDEPAADEPTDDEPAADDAGERPFEGETLTVLNWNDYGSDTDLAIEGFEELTGAEVTHVYHSGGEDLRQILRTGGVGEIDVALPNPTYVLQMAQEGLIQPVDPDLLPNLDKIGETFLDVDDIYLDGELYSVPWAWGSTGITYNTDYFDEAPTSWGVLWDPEMQGRVALMDSPIEAIMLTALYIGEDPHDPDLDAVRDALVEVRENVELFWGSSDDFTRAFTTESIVVGNFWAGDAGSLMASGEPVGYAIPEEGAPAWLSTWSIVADAPNPELAHAWIDWMISTEFLAGWANDPALNAPAPANVEAQEQLTDEAVERTQAFPELLDRLSIMQEVTPERQQEYTDLLAEVKAGV